MIRYYDIVILCTTLVRVAIYNHDNNHFIALILAIVILIVTLTHVR